MSKETQKIKFGDVVKLKSGGPRMTVDGGAPGGPELRYQCCWFDAGNHKSAAFGVEALEKCESLVEGDDYTCARLVFERHVLQDGPNADLRRYGEISHVLDYLLRTRAVQREHDVRSIVAPLT